jgi:hypothetical protein
MTTAAEPVSLLFAEVLLFWHAANYLLTADPTRSARRDRSSRARTQWLAWFLLRAAGAGVLTGAAAGWRPGITLAGAMVAGCVFLPLARWRWVPTAYLAELEIAGNIVFAAAAQWLLAHFDLHARWGLFRIPMPENLLSAYTISAALLIFVVRGGTFIVRGILDRAGTMPPPELERNPNVAPRTALELKGALPVDTIELNHGRLIGNVERLILVLFVANGQYTALAFFFAAKGLIRSKDVERRAWADYLILGSLTSFLIAVVAGLLIQAVFRSVT